MEQEIVDDKAKALRLLEQGLAEGCADYIAEVIVNLGDGTCDYIELCPTLERVIAKDVFHFFNMNIVGDDFTEDLYIDEPDPSRPVNLRVLAEKAIANIKQNAALPAYSRTHRLLKSNQPQWIKNTLEELMAEGCIDQTLLPILEKIAQKNIYRSYKMHNVLRVDCQLAQRAIRVMDMIRHPEIGRVPVGGTVDGKCPVCGSLPKELRVNYGRDDHYPPAYSKLITIDQDTYKCCPECRTYFFCLNIPQEYGTGNNAEEIIERFTPEQSRYLENLFLGNELFNPTYTQVQDCIKLLPFHQLLTPLERVQQRLPNVFKRFVWYLTEQVMKHRSPRAARLLYDYISQDPERARLVLRWCFNSARGKSPLLDLMEHCMNIVAGKI